MSVSAQNQELVDRFERFYRDRYKEQVLELAEGYPTDKRSLYIEFEDLLTWDVNEGEGTATSNLADEWLTHPSRFREAAEEALRLYDLPIDVSLGQAHVRLTDWAGELERKSVPEPDSDDIGDYIAIRGNLGKIIEKRPRVEEAAFVCQRCGVDTMVPQDGGSFQEPYQCEGCERQGPFKLDPERSEFVDIRKLKVEEPPDERASSTGQGQSIMAVVEDDLCDIGGGNGLADRGGETITVLGRFSLVDKDGSKKSREFDTYLDCQAIVFEDDDHSNIDIEAHRDEFEALAEQDDTVEQLVESLVPQLNPDEDLKVALEGAIAYLFGGYRVDPANGGSFRGDLHMTLIGDPGKGKSTLAKRINKISPKCEFRSGTALTKVGLTASAYQEDFDGQSEWVLEPGVLPRANGGHCIIDEVDALVDDKTKAIHDALEGEQMVKVDKATISADLPTRTGLLALGNPKYTRFNRYEPISEQVDLDEALIDRMDLLFALTDEVDQERDRTKADHVLDAYDELSREEIHERGHGPAPEERTTTNQPVSDAVFRAMVAYARENVFPTMTQEAKAVLREFYVEARDLNDGYQDEDSDRPIPATLRTLEAGIRIATAYARANLSETVETEHAERAVKVSKQVIGLNYDPDSGEFDDARTSRGMPKSQEERVKLIKDIINELDDGTTGGGAEREEVIKQAMDQGLGETQVKKELESLKQKGEIYTPQNGVFQTS